jgi:hypothetical protein
MIPEDWLKACNERLSMAGVPHKSRPWRALLEWGKETGSQFELVGSPMADAVFQWFYDRSPAGAHLVGPAFSGAFFYDVAFWEVGIPMGYGRCRLDARDSLIGMPNKVQETLYRNAPQLNEYICVWTDCVDYAYGWLDLDVDRRAGFGPQLLTSADGLLRTAATQLCQTPPAMQGMGSARLATELFLKAYLCYHGGLTPETARKTYGHNLERLLDSISACGTDREFEGWRQHLRRFPDISERYDGATYDLHVLWGASLVSGYKSNRFNWLEKSSKSSRESDG